MRRLGRIVAAAGQDGADGIVNRLSGRQAALEARGHLGEVAFARVEQVGAVLEVARVLARFALDDSRVGRGHEKADLPVVRHVADQLRMGRVNWSKPMESSMSSRATARRERFVIGEEMSGRGKVRLGLLVIAAVDGVVGALEEAPFGVLHEFERLPAAGARRGLELGPRHDDRGGDVVLELDLHRGMKVLAQTKRAPRAVAVESHAQVHRDELAVVALQFVGGFAVDDVHAEVVRPVLPPLRQVIALHHEHQFLEILRDGRQPFVVFGRIVALVGSEQLDDGAERAFGAEDRAGIRVGRVLETLAVIPGDQGRDLGRNPF